jgi:hypothetical protein
MRHHGAAKAVQSVVSHRLAQVALHGVAMKVSKGVRGAWLKRSLRAGDRSERHKYNYPCNFHKEPS